MQTRALPYFSIFHDVFLALVHIVDAHVLDKTKRYIHLRCEFFLVDQQSDFLPDGAVLALLPHDLLHLDEVVLLGAEDGAGSDNSDPSYEGRSWKIVMLHRIAGDEGAGSSQTRLAMYSDGSLLVLCQVDKFMHDVHGGDRAVGKIEFVVFDVSLDELGGVVGFVIEADYVADSEFFEDGGVVFGGEGSVLNEGEVTPYLSVYLSEGELKAMNLLGRIQFKSPFYIF